MQSRIIAILFALLIVCSCKGGKKAAGNPCEVTQDDYAVFNAVVTDIRSSADSKKYFLNAPIMVDDASDVTIPPDQASPKQWQAGSKSKEEPKQATIKDYVARSASSCPLSAGHGEGANYTILAPAEEERIFTRRDGWLVFYKQYPKARGVMSFSLPGYDPEKNEAVVFLRNSTGGIDGARRLYLLKKLKGEWRVANWVET